MILGCEEGKAWSEAFWRVGTALIFADYISI